MIDAVNKPGVLAFKVNLLPYSETFVLQQMEHLERYRRLYVGLRRVPGLAVPREESVVLSEGGLFGLLKECGYLLRGAPSGFLERLRAFQPSLLHAQFGYSGVAALPICKALKLPMVVTFHGRDATVTDDHVRRHGRVYDRMLLRRRAELFEYASRIIAVSQYIADRLVEQGCPREKITVHYIGIDVDAFRPLNDKDLDSSDSVLYVGRMVEKKGIEFLIRAMARVQAKFSRLKLSLIGEGPLEAELRALAVNLGVRAEFLGVQPADVVSSWMRKAAVLCAPSTAAANGDGEGLGMILLEAQACGTPVVASRHGGMPEAIVEGETGLLAAERDIDGIAGAIESMLGDKEWYERARKAARQYVVRHFDITRQSKLLEEIYDESIASIAHLP